MDHASKAIIDSIEWLSMDPRDRELVELRANYAAAQEVNRQNAAALRKLVREKAEEDDYRHVQGLRDAAMMEALPRARFAGGTRLDEMVVQVCTWLREARPELFEQRLEPRVHITLTPALLARLEQAGLVPGAGNVAAWLTERAERAQDFEDDARKVKSGQCAPDEVHCSCVPHLRRQIAEVEKERDAIIKALDMEGAPEVGEQGVTRQADRVGALLGRWQQAIYETICSMVPHPDRIDGGGSDGGPLDLTEAEVAQGLSQLIDERDAARAEVAAFHTEKMRLHSLSSWVEEARGALAGVRPGGENYPGSTIGGLLIVRQHAQEDYDSIYRVLHHDFGITLDIKDSRTRAIFALGKLRELLDAARKECDSLRAKVKTLRAEVSRETRIAGENEAMYVAQCSEVSAAQDSIDGPVSETQSLAAQGQESQATLGRVLHALRGIVAFPTAQHTPDPELPPDVREVLTQVCNMIAQES